MRKQLLFFLFTLGLNADIQIPPSSHQLLLVHTNGFDSSKGILQAYQRNEKAWVKVFEPIEVNLGRKGLAWGEGKIMIEHSKAEPHKREGDGKAPAGLFSLDGFFGYAPQHFNFPYRLLEKDDICVDDANSSAYNTLLKTKDKQSFQSYENMRRTDDLYALGILVGHNKQGLKNRGSCIFIHIQKAPKSPTAGCTSMSKEALLKLMKWLNVSQKPLLLQLPKPMKFY